MQDSGLNKNKFKASLLIVSIILVVLTILSYNRAASKFDDLRLEAAIRTEFPNPFNPEEYIVSQKLLSDYDSAYKEGGFEKGSGFWLIIFSNISTTLVTGIELIKKETQK
jgi:hypothetical protein